MICQRSDGAAIFHVFWSKADVLPEDLILTKGQRLTSIALSERADYLEAHLAEVVDTFVKSNIKSKLESE